MVTRPWPFGAVWWKSSIFHPLRGTSWRYQDFLRCCGSAVRTPSAAGAQNSAADSAFHGLDAGPRRGTLVRPEATPAEAWSEHSRQEDTLDLLLVETYASGWRLSDLVPPQWRRIMELLGPGDVPGSATTEDALGCWRAWQQGHVCWMDPNVSLPSRSGRCAESKEPSPAYSGHVDGSLAGRRWNHVGSSMPRMWHPIQACVLGMFPPSVPVVPRSRGPRRLL